MPLVRVELFDFRVTPEVSEELIAKMTDTLCEVVGEVVREHTWVIVEGHDPRNWGAAGKPLRVHDMPES